MAKVKNGLFIEPSVKLGLYMKVSVGLDGGDDQDCQADNPNQPLTTP